MSSPRRYLSWICEPPPRARATRAGGKKGDGAGAGRAADGRGCGRAFRATWGHRLGAPDTKNRGHKHRATRRRNEGPHRGARCWNGLFPVFPAEMRLFPVPTGTENMSNINGLRLFFGSVPGVPAVLCRHPSAERSKGTPAHRLARVYSAARTGEFCRPAWGVVLYPGTVCPPVRLVPSRHGGEQAQPPTWGHPHHPRHGSFAARCRPVLWPALRGLSEGATPPPAAKKARREAGRISQRCHTQSTAYRGSTAGASPARGMHRAPRAAPAPGGG